MGEAETHIRALAVLEAEHVVANGVPAAALLPEFAGMDGWQIELLADLVHLLAHDGDDLVQRALAQEEVAVDARAELADVAGAEQELVAGHFGVCRGLAEGGDKKPGPAMHRNEGVLSRPPRRTQDNIRQFPF